LPLCIAHGRPKTVPDQNGVTAKAAGRKRPFLNKLMAIYLRRLLYRIEFPVPRSKAEMPGFIKPQLATLKSKAPSGSQWLHEIKYDG